jgi:hypothetical protein
MGVFYLLEFIVGKQYNLSAVSFNAIYGLQVYYWEYLKRNNLCVNEFILIRSNVSLC